ncbi:MAG: cation-translocating P-type ATPase, partial [Chitinophagaceae bacterium]|nr:cation-translocating P-type ATPase [Chitinophagaceae bacterium]
MKKDIQSKVVGMTCGNCALSINHFLTEEGAENVVVNPSTGEVSFTIDEEKDEGDLFDGIERLGYKVQRDDHHEHSHDSITKTYLIISFCLWLPLMMHMFVDWHFLHNPIVQLILTTPIYILSILYFGKSAIRSLKNGIPNMDVLVFASSTAAYLYSIIGWILYPESVHNYLFFETTASIVTLVLAGNFLEEYTVTSTASSVKELMKYQKTTAKLVLKDSIGKETIIEVKNDELKLNDEIQVNTGDKIPTDGVIISGTASINESMMTGESVPVLKSENENVLGGTILESGNIRMKASAIGNQTALAHIIKLVNQAQAAKSPMQKIADKISAIFVPIVVSVALLTFLVNYFAFDISFANAMMRAIAVMVIACPCAMGLATPAAVMVGLGRAARNGILIKGGDSLENMKKIKY